MKKFIVVFFVSLIGLPSFSQLVAPQKGTGSKYFFSSYNIYFEVDTTNGARISSFKINNNEILYNQSTQNMNGSTFWPSPQSLWGWPPLSAIDNKPYKINISNNKLIATSSIDTKLKIRVIKKFFFDSRDTSIHINYCIKNENNVQKKYAHWEITRVPADGLVFFAKGQTDVSGNMATSVQEINGIYWYDQVNTISGDKFFCDGEGWLAFINQSNYLFVKKFANINSSAAATGEAEVEVYTSSDLAYSELENQGAYTSLNPGDSIWWEVKWYVRQLPQGVQVNKGNQDLVDFALQLVNKTDLPEIPDKPDNTSIKKFSSNKLKFIQNSYNKTARIENVPNYAFPIRVTFFNMLGTVVMSQTITNDTSIINLRNLISGNYIAEMKMSNGVVDRTMVIIVK